MTTNVTTYPMMTMSTKSSLLCLSKAEGEFGRGSMVFSFLDIDIPGHRSYLVDVQHLIPIYEPTGQQFGDERYLTFGAFAHCFVTNTSSKTSLMLLT